MDACLVFWSERPAREAVNWLRGAAAGAMRQHRSAPNGSIRGGMAVEVWAGRAVRTSVYRVKHGSHFAMLVHLLTIFWSPC
jgi:hypothetical protein